MHPYEVAATLRQRAKHESIRLNYGSLYSVFDSLKRRKLVEAAETQKEGRLPERTVYRLTGAGQVEAQDWLTELMSVPSKEYPDFAAALSFLSALPPGQAADLLEERAGRLEMEMARGEAMREVAQKHHLPRLLWVEEEFGQLLKRAELAYVKRLVGDIRSGRLEGSEWWRRIHEAGFVGPPPGFTSPGSQPDDGASAEGYDFGPGGER
jgi:DNA-binding PadR family transcriptional regulator